MYFLMLMLFNNMGVVFLKVYHLLKLLQPIPSRYIDKLFPFYLSIFIFLCLYCSYIRHISSVFPTILVTPDL